jgi:hypothetical protein
LGNSPTPKRKKGGQFYTLAFVVRVVVEVLAPYKGKVYDPCCGSGGMTAVNDPIYTFPDRAVLKAGTSVLDRDMYPFRRSRGIARVDNLN